METATGLLGQGVADSLRNPIAERPSPARDRVSGLPRGDLRPVDDGRGRHTGGGRAPDLPPPALRPYRTEETEERRRLT
ncbi:hypothetical protein [Streptomyces sp. NPDC006334]|uniref:hypothetical protein n=1 Tax=Streptomyces sp. NPDC006334 TaxID=3156754 RepID=UPI0033B99D02